MLCFRASRLCASFGQGQCVLPLLVFLLFCTPQFQRGGSCFQVSDDDLPLATRLWPSAESEAEWRRALNPQLTRLIKQRVDPETNTIVVLVGNDGFARDVFHTTCNLEALKIENYIVVALDEKLVEKCHRQQVPVIPAEWLISDDPKVRKKETHQHAVEATEWSTQSYNKLTRFKPYAVHLFLLLGVKVIMSDIDIAFLRNPIQYLEDLSHQSRAPLIFQNDVAPNVVIPAANTGFYLARSDRRIVKFFEQVSLTPSVENDQTLLNGLLCAGSPRRTIELGGHSCRHKFRGSTESFKVYFLEKRLFPNGSNNEIWGPLGNQTLGQRLTAAKVPHAYIIHNNWIVGEAPKWNRFKELEIIFWDETTEKCVIPKGFREL